MTVKDYETITLGIKGGLMSVGLKPHSQYKLLHVLAYTLGQNDPKFNRTEFIKACTPEQELK